MKKYKEKKTGRIWYAVDRQHIKYFEENPNFTEVKEVVDKKPKTTEANKSTTETASTEENK